MHEPEEERLRSAALQTSKAILQARQQAEEELLQAKEDLRESQERLQVALRAAGMGTFRWQLAADVVELDASLGRLLGIPAGAGPRTFQQFLAAVHPEDRVVVADRCTRTAREGVELDVEFRVHSPAGVVRWLRERGRAVLDAAGKPSYVTGACVDVTSRKDAEAALHDTAQRLQLALAAGELGDWSWDAATDRVTFGARAAAIFEVPVEPQITWTALRERLHEDDRDRARIAVETSLATHSLYAIEYRVRLPDGGLRWVAARGAGNYGEDGAVVGMTGVVQDVTTLKQTEERLREETRVLELLNDTGATIAAQLDLQSLLQSVTAAATELSGARFGAFFYNVVDEQGESYLLYTLAGAPREAFEKLGLPRNTPVFEHTFRGLGPMRSGDITKDPRYGTMAPHFGMPKGHLPVRSYLAIPVRSASGEVIGGLFFGHPEPDVFSERAERLVAGVAAQAGIAVDNARLYEAARVAAAERTALLESERAARTEAERLGEIKEAFLATLSHELRTPLSAILGWVSVLRVSKDAADLDKGLATIERNARLQVQLIDDLLDSSRITSGKLRLDVQAIYPAQVVEAAVDSMRPAAAAKAIRLEALLDSHAGPISGDAARLQQIVWNLLSNAVKFTERGGRVQVVLQRVRSRVEICVADTGIGIRPEFLPHLFERFRQADASTTRQQGGLGLGLSIVKRLTELHGGTIAVTSPGEGEGTTVRVHFPVLVAPHAAEQGERWLQARESSGPRFDLPDLSGLSLLVVDDQKDAREFIQRVLEECGAHVVVAGSAAEALALVEAVRPAVLISDIGMPDVDGFELLQRVRALGPARGGGAPAVALAAFARSEDRTRALRAGFLVHLAKPVDPAELVATVASVAGRTGSPA